MMNRKRVKGRNTYEKTEAAEQPYRRRIFPAIFGWTTGEYLGPTHPIVRTGKLTSVPTRPYPTSTASDQRVLLQAPRRILSRLFPVLFGED